MRTFKHFWQGHPQRASFRLNQLHHHLGTAILGLFAVFATTTAAAVAQPGVGITIFLDTSYSLAPNVVRRTERWDFSDGYFLIVSEYYCFGHPNYGQHRFKLIRPFSEHWEDLRNIERNSGIEGLRDDACSALRRGAYDLNGVDDYIQLAFNLQSQNRIAEGIEVLQNAVELYPSDAALYNNLGLLLRISQDFEAAIFTYRQGIDRAFDLELKAILYTGLGNTFDDAGRTEEAFDAYRQAIILDPEFAIVHYDFAIALQRAGRIDEAIQECQEALKLDSSLTEAQELLTDLEATQVPVHM